MDELVLSISNELDVANYFAAQGKLSKSALAFIRRLHDMLIEELEWCGL